MDKGIASTHHQNSSAMVATVEVKYQSILPTFIDYLMPVVTIEFSAMSLEDPYNEKEIITLIHSVYPDVDTEVKCLFMSVLPERTFFEKIFLLHEEYQKNNPRTKRMSRHLYDLVKIMDTPFARSALQNKVLYQSIINHREKFNNIQGIDYRTHYPEWIQICPPEHLVNEWANDYRLLQQSFIYEKSKPFDELIARLLQLTTTIREINL